MLVQDVSKDPRYLDVFPGTASELAVPVSFGGETIGVLNAESLRQGDFGRRQMKMMSSLGVTLAAAVRNSLLYGEIFEHSDRMSEAQAFARELNSTLDLRQILDVARDRLPNLVRARRIAIFRYDDEWLILDLVAHNFPGFSGRVQIAATDECDLTRALATNTSRNEVVPERQARGGQPHPAYPSGPFMSILLKVGERVVGVILFTERIASGPFTDQDFHFGNTVGEHLAVAIANSDLYEKTLRLSQTDGLTGLMVHRAFYEELDSRLVEAKMGERPLSLVMGDIDRFKSVNDRFGHPFGDRILSHVARVIREAIRPQDIAARYGGEEFVMILPDTDRRGAFAAAERIRTRLERESFRSSEGPLTVTISFGVAEFDPASDRTAFVESVDRALYRAKGNGRNRTEVFEAASPGE
jgi:diguanylate cyclase (GGDEF)-like protein